MRACEAPDVQIQTCESLKEWPGRKREKKTIILRLQGFDREDMRIVLYVSANYLRFPVD